MTVNVPNSRYRKYSILIELFPNQLNEMEGVGVPL